MYKRQDVTYVNPTGLDHGACRISAVRLDGADVAFADHSAGVVIARSVLAGLDEKVVHGLEIDLGA